MRQYNLGEGEGEDEDEDKDKDEDKDRTPGEDGKHELVVTVRVFCGLYSP